MKQFQHALELESVFDLDKDAAYTGLGELLGPDINWQPNRIALVPSQPGRDDQYALRVDYRGIHTFEWMYRDRKIFCWSEHQPDCRRD